MFEHPVSNVPAEGLTLESLLASDTLMADEAAIFAGQQQAWYLDVSGEATHDSPAFPPLLAFSEAAVLDEAMVSQLSGYADSSTLEQAGYVSSAYLFPRPAEAALTLWAARQSYATYAGSEHFLLPVTYRDTLLTGALTVTRDAHDCVVIQAQDATGLTTAAEYDWRFLAPFRTTDVNDNQKMVTLDALGRVTSSRFSGTENGAAAGYGDTGFAPSETADAALSLVAPLPVHQCMVYITDSWMLEGAEKLPPHVVMLTTDRYDTDAAQQVRQTVVFADGFGRTLQTAIRQAGGEAWQRQAD